MVAREKWGWSRWSAIPVFGLFLLVDLSYFSGNIVKIAVGGWFPLGVGILVSILFTTWRQGRAVLWKRLQERSVPIERFLQDLPRMDVIRRFGRFPHRNSALESNSTSEELTFLQQPGSGF